MSLEEIEAAYQLFSVKDKVVPDDAKEERKYAKSLSLSLAEEMAEVRGKLRKNKFYREISGFLGSTSDDEKRRDRELILEEEVLFAELQSTEMFMRDYVLSIYKGINDVNFRDAHKLLTFTELFYGKNVCRLEGVRDGLSTTSETGKTGDLVFTDEMSSFDEFFTKELDRIKAIRPLEKTKKGD